MSKKKKVIIVLIIIAIMTVSLFIIYEFIKEKNEDVSNTYVMKMENWNFTAESNQISETTVIEDLQPGSSGSFEIDIDVSNSNIDVEYEITFLNETQKPQNLKFEYEDKSYKELEEIEEELKGTIHKDEEDKTRAIIINWEWPYETRKY